MTGERIPVNVLCTQRIANVSPALARELKLDEKTRSVALISTDCDDATYLALDEATKASDVTVAYARSLYAGAGSAATAVSGEVIGILAGPSPSEVESGLAAALSFLSSGVGFCKADGAGGVVYLAHCVSATGAYLSALAGIPQGQALAYLIAPPVPAVFALDAALKAQKACVLSDQEAKSLSGFILRANGTMNPAIVGKSAHRIAQMAGLTRVPEDTSVLVARESHVGAQYPYAHEKLCPILALYVEPDEEAALRRCCEILRFEGSGHTFCIHTEDRAAVDKFAAAVPVSRVLVNTPGALGGVGATTGLFPALTLGCGAVGGSSSSNNIGPLDLINIRRVAWGLRDSISYAGHTKAKAADAPQPVISEELVAYLTDRILEKLR